eukprot:4873726-Alexandrium_andersonii.AAC.1
MRHQCEANSDGRPRGEAANVMRPEMSQTHSAAADSRECCRAGLAGNNCADAHCQLVQNHANS